MKLSKYVLLFALTFSQYSCIDLDIPPMNIVQDKDLFTSENGVKSYFARLYSNMFVEDFRYTYARGFNNSWAFQQTSAITGEALNRDVGGASTENVQIWNSAYRMIREINYFMETLPKYKANFTESQVNQWMGEAYFLRAHTYFALAKRYGGVPIVDKVLQYPEQPLDELKIQRSSEEAVFTQVEQDFDKAYQLLPETSSKTRANKYTVAAFKSRAMLFAGSIAKYNEVDLKDKKDNSIRLCGLSRDKATYYFKKAYEAAKLVEGHYSLYMNGWKADDKKAQCQNYIDMYCTDDSPENIFIRQYNYPNSVHGYDVYNIPRQFKTNGWSTSTTPTLNFVELFDGFPKDENGHIITLSENNTYNLYDNVTDLFKDAEPRLKATVILPGEDFKGETVELWRGIYIGDETKNIKRLQKSSDVMINYENDPDCKDLIVSSQSAENQTVYTLSNGQKMNAGGGSGCFYGTGECAFAGFVVRKWLNPNMPHSLVMERRSDQSWLEMRYAEVLLNRAEAAYELHEEGNSDVDYLEDATKCINLVRERAGADLLAGKADLTKVDVRNERRKELSFENKAFWDLRRWRTYHIEQNATRYRALFPFYADKANKWFFDDKLNDKIYTFDIRWYYNPIPNDEVVKSDLTQNRGY